MSAFTLMSCADNPKPNPNAYEEYASYRSKGGSLSYEEWLKKKDMSKKGKGDEGVSIKSMKVNEKGELIIELSDGTIINAGVISDPSIVDHSLPSL